MNEVEDLEDAIEQLKNFPIFFAVHGKQVGKTFIVDEKRLPIFVIEGYMRQKQAMGVH